MTLATHAVVGAAIARLIPKHPIAGFFFAFISHFLIDAIPHGHYRLFSTKRDSENPLNDDMVLGKNFILDLLNIGLDLLIGIGLTFAIFNQSSYLTLCLGIIGGVLPDALQFAYWKIRKEPLTSLQKFHHNIHAKKKFNDNLPIAFLIEATAILAITLLRNF